VILGKSKGAVKGKHHKDEGRHRKCWRTRREGFWTSIEFVAKICQVAYLLWPKKESFSKAIF
jgi:hypothetical protein